MISSLILDLQLILIRKIYLKYETFKIEYSNYYDDLHQNHHEKRMIERKIYMLKPDTMKSLYIDDEPKKKPFIRPIIKLIHNAKNSYKIKLDQLSIFNVVYQKYHCFQIHHPEMYYYLHNICVYTNTLKYEKKQKQQLDNKTNKKVHIEIMKSLPFYNIPITPLISVF